MKKNIFLIALLLTPASFVVSMGRPTAAKKVQCDCDGAWGHDRWCATQKKSSFIPIDIVAWNALREKQARERALLGDELEKRLRYDTTFKPEIFKLPDVERRALVNGLTEARFRELERRCYGVERQSDCDIDPSSSFGRAFAKAEAAVKAAMEERRRRYEQAQSQRPGRRKLSLIEAQWRNRQHPSRTKAFGH